MWCWLKENHDVVSSLISSLAAFLAVSTFVFAICRYNRAENWKRTEFLAKLYQDFIKDPACKRVMRMLDWTSGREIDFGTVSKRSRVRYDGKLLMSALRLHDADERSNPQGDNYSNVEMMIRDDFDQFFSYIEQFDHAIQNGLVGEAQVEPYFAYLVGVLKGRKVNGKDSHLPGEERTSIDKYINRYGFTGVRRFLDRWK
jgi:hypothetical protein